MAVLSPGMSMARRRWLLAIALLALVWYIAPIFRGQGQWYALHGYDFGGSDSHSGGGGRGAASYTAPKRPSLPAPDTSKFQWAGVELHHPVPRDLMAPLPEPSPHLVPRIQHSFAPESAAARETRLWRREQVRRNFTHAWQGYRQRAWGHDEVGPLSGMAHDPFGGWAATMVDSLDTLWIMGLREDFDAAVRAVEAIEFGGPATTQEDVNVFETTIRLLGGLLGAYDLTNGRYPGLLRKAVELGNMLYVAFDTPNHMPVTRWKFRTAKAGHAYQVAAEAVLVAEIGSFTLEFTRLSQLTGDNKYYDLVTRVMAAFEDTQDRTRLPGMWPVVVNARTLDFVQHGTFTIGGMADSLYEYLPKMFLLLGGATQLYRDLYIKALAAMKQHIFYRPMTREGLDILLPGDFHAAGSVAPAAIATEPRAQHLGCFAGGMVALAARGFAQERELDTARRLVSGCLWGYQNSAGGIMPEIMHTGMCPREVAGGCAWDEGAWLAEVRRHDDDANEIDSKKIARLRLMPGITAIEDRRYILRPEAIESVFVMWRIGGDAALQEWAWHLFETIVKYTTTEIAHAALEDCTTEHPGLTKTDRMESFWLAETLKYFYLMFEEPDVVSLDEFVFNTEAHPLRWRVKTGP